ncbi:hypothetical protein CCC_00891 [Paramagnetospirillum magnetotacticum MS-1]|uniref:Heparinase II/III-like C-terminal domain-containing protein n=1 Tax=Paramagnetospirillum magnetotacticum MS-1 TaxID=272627 RepID=A0A0C2YSX9_PARME|nr:hypothetical protein CCC_00891 [Paramagnetospirillum magnetotacticum MS-1]
MAADPVLRRWIVLRALRLTPGEPPYDAHRPPYLGGGWSSLPAETPRATFAAAPPGAPSGPLRLRLAGQTVTLEPGGEAELIVRNFGDIETQLSLHRFAWVPLMGKNDDPRWVDAVWSAWMERFGTPDSSWAWHPYTAAERAINLLAFARRHGLPKAAAECLAAHAPAIAASLEYFGDHHSSNHLANNGRGLYLLGLALGLPQATETGARILVEEGRRIFRPCGVLREGSTHYHLLLTRSWAEVWLAAHAAGRPEAEEFGRVLDCALSVLPHFALAGRFPLMGDVSPDCPPSDLFGLLPGASRETGWMGRLEASDRDLLLARLGGAVDGEVLAADGWRRFDLGDWSGLWHADPDGFSHMPGHGHQDCGSFELHYRSRPLFIDPGRGSYAIAGEAEEYVSARAHNGLTVDGADPYAANKPYFAPAFRRRMAGPPPRLERRDDGLILESHGFVRLGGVGIWRRSWSFTGPRLILGDEIAGRGRHRVVRRLQTTMEVERNGEGLILRGADGSRVLVTAPGAQVSVVPALSWQAYGEGEPASRIEISVETALPWRGEITVEGL